MFWDVVRVNDIIWNFEKFVIGRNGQPLYRINPATWDDGNMVRPLVEVALNVPGNAD